MHGSCGRIVARAPAGSHGLRNRQGSRLALICQQLDGPLEVCPPDLASPLHRMGRPSLVPVWHCQVSCKMLLVRSSRCSAPLRHRSTPAMQPLRPSPESDSGACRCGCPSTAEHRQGSQHGAQVMQGSGCPGRQRTRGLALEKARSMAVEVRRVLCSPLSRHSLAKRAPSSSGGPARGVGLAALPAPYCAKAVNTSCTSRLRPSSQSRGAACAGGGRPSLSVQMADDWLAVRHRAIHAWP